MNLIEVDQFWQQIYPKNETRIVQVIKIRDEFIRVKTLVRIPGRSTSSGYVTWISWTRFLNNFVKL